ncbi:hypothetical protein [Gemmobacter sp.]|uniref:hypothetical protein n=1 Tax=Gemmobacter sp. TaxID=1898957 RepID=UPI002B001C5F|nr:hypothetical protein [Gemmobacter sp.]
MTPPRQPLFVAPPIYRSRRLRDAARILPVVGAVLMLVPMLWEPGPGGARSTARDGIYLFVLWGALIVAARLLAPRLDELPPDTDPDEG